MIFELLFWKDNLVVVVKGVFWVSWVSSCFDFCIFDVWDIGGGGSKGCIRGIWD